MKRFSFLLMILSPAMAAAQAIQPGNWDVKSTPVELVVPGTPSFMLNMMKGRTKTDHKCVLPTQAPAGISALLAPDPKANCRVTTANISDGHIEQEMTCPQKSGAPMQVIRTGTYTVAGYVLRLTMAGQTPKGAMRVIMDQVATHTASVCRS